MILKQLEEYKNETALVNSFMLNSKSAGMANCKPCIKGAKKGTEKGSKGKGKGKNPKDEPKDGTKNPTAASGKKKDDKTRCSTQHQSLNMFELDL